MFYFIKKNQILRVFILIGIMAIILDVAANKIYPIKDLNLIINYSEKYKLDKSLVCAIIHTESKFDTNATSNKSACGYMQIIQKTAIWCAEELGIDNFSYDKINQPDLNIKIGTYYMSKLIKQFGNVDTALAAYNAGSGNVEKWLSDKRYSDDGKNLKLIPFPETEKYVEKVNRNYMIYKFIFKYNFLKGFNNENK